MVPPLPLVLVLVGVVGLGRDRRCCCKVEVCVGLAIVVLRPVFSRSVAGAEGGGGRLERSEEEFAGRMLARQRKHSPVP